MLTGTYLALSVTRERFEPSAWDSKKSDDLSYVLVNIQSPPRGTHHALREKVFGVAFEFRYDILVRRLSPSINPQPNATEIELADEAFTNLVPCGVVAPCAGRGEARPVAIIKQDLEGAFLGQLARDDLEDKYTGFCERSARPGVKCDASAARSGMRLTRREELVVRHDEADFWILRRCRLTTGFGLFAG